MRSLSWRAAQVAITLAALGAAANIVQAVVQLLH